MVVWWNGLGLAGQIFAAIAIPATVVMLVQAILLLVGVGIDGDIDGDGVPDADVDSDGLGLISIRGIVAFFSIGGWAGFVADAGGLPVVISVLIALASGLLALIGIAVLFKSFYKLQGSGNLNVDHAIGKTGKVYLTIPPKGQGQGKINLLLQEQLVELDALNQGDAPLLTGQSVIVCSVADSQTVVVSGFDTEEKTATKGGISKWN
jgi:hypothetical protein